jgi:hypothetical protein
MHNKTADPDSAGARKAKFLFLVILKVAAAKN